MRALRHHQDAGQTRRRRWQPLKIFHRSPSAKAGEIYLQSAFDRRKVKRGSRFPSAKKRLDPNFLDLDLKIAYLIAVIL